MSKITYVPKKFEAAQVLVIEQANEIIDKYRTDGYVLTLRQLYYQFVAGGLIPNTMASYKRLAGIMNDARLAGMVDWEMLEDRTRGIESPNMWDEPSQVLRASAQQYQIDLWFGQEWRPEVWIEKEALAGVVEGVCDEERIAYLACRGYTSQSEAWRAAMRMVQRFREDGQRTLVLHLGDHDPSGLDMTRDNRDRLVRFCEKHLGMVPFKFVRIALNMDQVEQYNPPPNPAKSTDARFKGYADEFGYESWELDALEPNVITQLITDRVAKVREPVAWAERVEEETNEKAQLKLVADNFDECVEFLNGES